VSVDAETRSDAMQDRDLEQRIRERAFFLWIEQGRPEGCDQEHWRQAESELTAGIAAPESEAKPERGQATQAEPAEPHLQAAPGVEAIGQIRYAAARDVDQGGDTAGQQQQSQSAGRKSTGRSWGSYWR
jgi:hypothetical protein